MHLYFHSAVFDLFYLQCLLCSFYYSRECMVDYFCVMSQKINGSKKRKVKRKTLFKFYDFEHHKVLFFP